MANQTFQPAGDAEETKFASAPNPVGLYQNTYNGKLVGVIDPIQGDAVVRNGFQLVEEGREAAMTSQDDLDAREEKWLKDNDPNAAKTELQRLQQQLDEANQRLRDHEETRELSDRSDTAAEQAALVPLRNIKAPVQSITSPDEPKGDDLKAAEAARKEASQPTQTAEEQLEASGLMDNDGKNPGIAAKKAEADEAHTTGLNENAELKPGATAAEQLSGVIPGEEKESKADKASTSAPTNTGNRGQANVQNDKLKAQDKKENK